MIYDITPVSKPRMTQSDKWKKRKCVQEYWAFKAECRLKKVKIENGNTIIFVVPMPASWSTKKRLAFLGKPHTQRPDIDNQIKAIFDAVFDEDSHIHDIHLKKVWGECGQIIID